MNASWLSAVVGADAAGVVGFLIAALAVFLGIWACFRFFRRKSGYSFRKSGRKSGHRISVRDIVAIDNRRRLVLIRRDDVEHLLLTGGDSDLVIETFTDLPAGKEPGLEARLPARAPENAKLVDIKAEPAAARPAEKGRAAENAYMARPQPAPRTGNTERQRDPAAEAAMTGRIARDAPPNRELRSYRPGANPLYPLQAAPHNAGARAEERTNAPYREAPRPNNDRQEAAWQGDMERPRQPPRDMRGNNFVPSEEPAFRQENREAPAARRGDGMQPDNGQSAPHLRNAYPAADADHNMRREGSGHNNFANAAEGAQQAGNPFPSYPMRDDRPAQAHNMQRNGPNAAPQAAAYGNEGGNRADGQTQIMHNGAKDAAARPIIADSYAPYLGYMPHAASQPPMHNTASAANGNTSDRLMQQDSRQDKNSNGNNVRNFETIQRGHSAHNGDMHGNPARNMHSNEDTGPSLTQPMQQNFQNRGEQKPGNGFDLAPQNAANGFAKINPPEENDFDKILQDELLRAPNGIKFPSSQKK